MADHGVSHATLCGSGTEALTLALEGAAVLSGERSRPVALPAFSCFDVASAAARHGHPVIFYDVEPATLGPDPESLRNVMAAGARAVVLCSLFGVPLDWDVLDPILGAGDAVVIEDAAQGHGARWRGRKLGGHGRLGVLSFGRGKGWTGGAGGALLIRDGDDRERLLSLLQPAAAGNAAIILRAAAHWVLGRPSLYGLPRMLPGLGLGETTYREVQAPTGMGAAAAALLLDSEELAEVWAGVRIRAAGHYNESLEIRTAVSLVAEPLGGRSGYGRFPIVVPGGMAAFRDPRSAIRLGAAPSYPTTLPELTAMQALRPTGFSRNAPGASTLVRQLITLPTHDWVGTGERNRLMALLPE